MSNTITHHLTDAILTAYAAGTLPEAFNVIVATHISMCDECRAQLAAHEEVGGAVLERAGLVDMADDALEACFARIDAFAEDEAGAIRLPQEGNGALTNGAQTNGIFPAPLAEYVGSDLKDVKWKPPVWA